MRSSLLPPMMTSMDLENRKAFNPEEMVDLDFASKPLEVKTEAGKCKVDYIINSRRVATPFPDNKVRQPMPDDYKSFAEKLEVARIKILARIEEVEKALLAKDSTLRQKGVPYVERIKQVSLADFERIEQYRQRVAKAKIIYERIPEAPEFTDEEAFYFFELYTGYPRISLHGNN